MPTSSGPTPSSTADAAASGVKVPSTSGYVAPAIARSSIATTSSKTRRPFGKPARSPPSRPKALCRREASPSGRAMWRAETVRGSA
jgi:hypothetical protein